MRGGFKCKIDAFLDLTDTETETEMEGILKSSNCSYSDLRGTYRYYG